MQGVTLAVALFACVAILAVPRRYAFPIFLGALAWYPSYLAVTVGTVDFTVARIVILAVLVKAAVTRAEGRSVSWGWVDMCIVFWVGAGCLADALTALDLSRLLEFRAGTAFDSMLPYFAIRLLIRRREDYTVLLAGALVVGAPLAVLGAYECLTGHNPIGFMGKYAFYGAVEAGRVLAARSGLWRAEGAFSHPISFGLFFALLGPLCAGLWGYARRKTMLLVGLLLMVVGMVSSMSSGPWLAGIVACGIMAVYPLRQHWKTALVLIIVWLSAVDVGSNRHWYDVLGEYCTFSEETSWYRIRLIKVALGGGMSGHWLAGFGPFTDPGWGPRIDGRQETWILNHYVLILVSGGLLGLVPFLAAVGGSFAALRRGYGRTFQAGDRWLVWGMVSSLAGILAAMFSVSLMGQMMQLFFIVCALGVNVGEVTFLVPAGVTSESRGDYRPMVWSAAERPPASV